MPSLNNNGKLDKLSYPLIQGGMGVGVSLSSLAGSVASYGCMGVLSSANIGYKDPNFWQDPKAANEKALRKQIQRARDLSKGHGLLGINIMEVVKDYNQMLEISIDEGIDAVITGAGLPLDLAKKTKGKDVMIAPIVSSTRALKLIIKKWLKSANRLPDFVVLEGPMAGGHLGFHLKDLEQGTKALPQLALDLKKYLEEICASYKVRIPLFVAGGVKPEDYETYLNLGIDGIQIGTPFILTKECDASETFKEVLKMARKEDLKIFTSPVGLPGQGVRTPLINKVEQGHRFPPKQCISCIRTCNPKETPYCITKALIDGVKGDLDQGLFFAGTQVSRLNEIRSVKEVIEEYVKENL